MLRQADDADVLEIGARTWSGWLDAAAIRPRSLTCVNLSIDELRKGVALAQRATIRPGFALMDAHVLAFPDEQFDIIMGGSILHHLSLGPALDEIYRVLKPNGTIVFREPLAVNPVAALVRLLTPKARTVDEQPFGRRELADIGKRFAIDCYFEQFVSVPAGVLSRILFKSPENALMRAAFRIDMAILKASRRFGIYYRVVNVVGRKRAMLSGGGIVREGAFK